MAFKKPIKIYTLTVIKKKAITVFFKTVDLK